MKDLLQLSQHATKQAADVILKYYNSSYKYYLLVSINCMYLLSYKFLQTISLFHFSHNFQFLEKNKTINENYKLSNQLSITKWFDYGG